jgi:hypothetical protein
VIGCQGPSAIAVLSVGIATPSCDSAIAASLSRKPSQYVLQEAASASAEGAVSAWMSRR